MQSRIAFGNDLNVMPYEEYVVIMLFCARIHHRSGGGRWQRCSIALVLSFSFLRHFTLRDNHGARFVFVSHRVRSSEGRRTYGNDAQTGFGKWSDSCELQSRWTDVPFTELNVIGWHFPTTPGIRLLKMPLSKKGPSRLTIRREGMLTVVIKCSKVTSIMFDAD